MINPRKINLSPPHPFLALAIGNSRLHFAYFEGGRFARVWDGKHLSQGADTLPKTSFPPEIAAQIGDRIPLYIASVVPQQTDFWRHYSHSKIITLKHLPLEGIYPTMGIDRALAVYGAAKLFGLPVLVIDGGTALTFTGMKENYKLVGGAILPGLRSQFLTLSRTTATLPEIELPDRLLPRWNLDTEGAISSGILYTILAGVCEFIRDWWQKFPESRVIFTGGDGVWLATMLDKLYPQMKKIQVEENLIFAGIREIAVCEQDLKFE